MATLLLLVGIAGATTIDIGEERVDPGGTVQVPVIFSNTPSPAIISAFEFRVTYDSTNLGLPTAVAGADQANLTTFIDVTANPDVIRVSGFVPSAPSIGDGEILLLEFTLGAGVPLDQYPLVISAEEVRDTANDLLAADIVDGALYVGTNVIIGNGGGQPGDSVDLAVTFVGSPNPADISAFEYYVTFDAAWADPVVAVGADQSNLTTFIDSVSPGFVRVTGFITGPPNVGDGHIQTLTFTIPGAAASGTYPIQISLLEVRDTLNAVIPSAGVDGSIFVGTTIQVGSASGLPGNVLTVPITLTNAPDPAIISAFRINMSSDVAIGLPTAAAGPDQGNLTPIVDDLGGGTYRVTGLVASSPNIGSGHIMDLSYTVPAGQPDGVYPLGIVAVEVRDTSNTLIGAQALPGELVIEQCDSRFDFDNDGKPDDCEDGTFTVLMAGGSTWTNYWLPDSDGDGLLDGEEALAGRLSTTPTLVLTDARKFDTDLDGFGDGIEYYVLGTNPLDINDPDTSLPAYADADGDGAPFLVDPDDSDPDFDNDGYIDGYELAHRTNPSDPSSKPPLGDGNGDGFVDNVDLTETLNYQLGNSGLPSAPGNTDLTLDGWVDNTDSTKLLNYTIGNSTLP
ncbi:hypothetical protein KQI84_00830 [bacterium]|nr:hypothetical protein [bacterium]